MSTLKIAYDTGTETVDVYIDDVCIVEFSRNEWSQVVSHVSRRMWGNGRHRSTVVKRMAMAMGGEEALPLAALAYDAI